MLPLKPTTQNVQNLRSANINVESQQRNLPFRHKLPSSLPQSERQRRRRLEIEGAHQKATKTERHEIRGPTIINKSGREINKTSSISPIHFPQTIAVNVFLICVIRESSAIDGRCRNPQELFKQTGPNIKYHIFRSADAGNHYFTLFVRQLSFVFFSSLFSHLTFITKHEKRRHHKTGSSGSV